MRVQHREHARTYLSWDRLRKYPLTTLIHAAGAMGLPLEAVRWINGNRHKPKYWLENLQRHELWPTNVADRLKLKFHRVDPKVYEVASEDDLRSFMCLLEPSKRKGETLTRRYKEWWVSQPGDYIFNREIVEPKTNPSYLNGAMGIRFDDDFWVCAVLPYEFRNLSIQTLVAILYPDIEHEECHFLPDHGSDEMQAYMEEQALRMDAWRIVVDRAPDQKSWESITLQPDDDGGFVAEFTSAEGKVIYRDHVSGSEIARKRSADRARYEAAE